MSLLKFEQYLKLEEKLLSTFSKIGDVVGAPVNEEQPSKELLNFRHLTLPQLLIDVIFSASAVELLYIPSNLPYILTVYVPPDG